MSVALHVRVCRLADVVDGEPRAFRVAGVTWPIVVTRVDGELVACAGVCPHEDVELGGGELDGACIVCPGHGYAFDLHTGRCTHDASLVLRRYPIAIRDGDVWVDLV